MLNAIVIIMEIAFVNKAISYINSSVIGKRLVNATFWSLLGGIFARGLTFLSFIIVARVLGKELLGELAIVQSTAIMIATFATFGLSLTASKHVAEYRIRDPEKTARVLKLSGSIALISGILFCGLLLIFSSWLALEVLAAPHLTGLLQISAIMLLFLALDGAQTGALIGFEAFKVTAILNLIKGVVTFIALVTGVYIDGLRGVTIALVISSIIGWIINRIALNREIKRNLIPPAILKDCKDELSLLWRFSLPSAISGVLLAPTLWACSIMLVNEPGGYNELGVYDIANRVYQIMIFLGVSIGAPLLPLLAGFDTLANEKVRKVNMLLSWGLGFILIFPLMLFPEIIEWVFGDKFSGQNIEKTMVILLLASCVVLYKQGLARALAVNNLLWWGLLDNLIWALLMLFAAYNLVKFGALGLALTILISYIITTLIFMPFYVKRKVVPSSTLISLESCIVWIVAIILFINYDFFIQFLSVILISHLFYFYSNRLQS